MNGAEALFMEELIMKLWTVQPISVLERLEQNQVYRCDESLCGWNDTEEHLQAHQWMARQLEQRVSAPPEGVKFPLWAWHTTYGKHEAPDFRKSMFRRYEDQRVCIELDIPDDKVLLSDYDAWQEVLNDEYIDFALSEEDYRLERANYESLMPEEQLEVKVKSWERAFGILPYRNNWRRIGFFVQACFWEIKLEYVKSVRRLRSKGK